MIVVQRQISIFKVYHGENKLIFNEMMMRSALYYTNTLSWIFIVPAHWNNSPLGHITQGRIQAPLKLEKIWFFGVKSWFFTWNTPTIFAPPSAIGKIGFFGLKSWFFTRNTPTIFAPPTTCIPGSAPVIYPVSEPTSLCSYSLMPCA